MDSHPNGGRSAFGLSPQTMHIHSSLNPSTLQLLLLTSKPKLKLCELELAVCEAGSDAALYCCCFGSNIVSESGTASSGSKTGQYCAKRDISVILQGLSCVEIKCLLVTSLLSLAQPLKIK